MLNLDPLRRVWLRRVLLRRVWLGLGWVRLRWRRVAIASRILVAVTSSGIGILGRGRVALDPR